MSGKPPRRKDYNEHDFPIALALWRFMHPWWSFVMEIGEEFLFYFSPLFPVCRGLFKWGTEVYEMGKAAAKTQAALDDLLRPRKDVTPVIRALPTTPHPPNQNQGDPGQE